MLPTKNQNRNLEKIGHVVCTHKHCHVYTHTCVHCIVLGMSLVVYIFMSCDVPRAKKEKKKKKKKGGGYFRDIFL